MNLLLAAPRLPAAGPGASEAFRYQNVSERPAVSLNDPQLAPIPVFVPTAGLHKLERTDVKQLLQAAGGARSQFAFILASQRMGFGRIDIRYSDFQTLKVKRVAVDHTIMALEPAAHPELGE